MDPPTHLLGLPNEIILYILRQFLDLGDVWGLLQVSKQLRHFAMDTIHKRWKIDPVFTPSTIMKIQCRAALIALERLSHQIPMQQQHQPQQPYYRSIGYDEISTPASPQHITLATTHPQDFDHGNDTMDDRNDVDEDDDDSEAMEDLYQAAMTMRSAGLDIDASVPLATGTPTTTNAPPAPPPSLAAAAAATATATNTSTPLSINLHEFLLTTTTTTDCDTTTTGNDNSHLQAILLQEERLHQRIIRGINACKHKYVLIEDIDIRNRIRATVDVIFHHTVFVSAIHRQDQQRRRNYVSINNYNLAVMMVRLLTRLDASFPSYCREITYTLVDHIKAFLEYTGYRILGQRAGCLHGRELRLDPLIFGSTSSSSSQVSATSSSSSFSSSSSTVDYYYYYYYHHHPSTTSTTTTSILSPRTYTTTTTTTTSTTSTPICSLPPTLYSIAACFDLMGAAFIGKMVGEAHVECAVQRVCELLTDDPRHGLRQTKRTLLVDLLDGWLTCKRGLMASDLCRFVQSEIDKCQ